jgi:hypothetical protein
MKKINILEYVKKLTDDDLKFVNIRLSRRMGDDVGETIELLQEHPEIDKCLSTASSANDLFDMVDQIDNYIQQEVKRRNYHR